MDLFLYWLASKTTPITKLWCHAGHLPSVFCSSQPTLDLRANLSTFAQHCVLFGMGFASLFLVSTLNDRSHRRAFSHCFAQFFSLKCRYQCCIVSGSYCRLEIVQCQCAKRSGRFLRAANVGRLRRAHARQSSSSLCGMQLSQKDPTNLLRTSRMYLLQYSVNLFTVLFVQAQTLQKLDQLQFFRQHLANLFSPMRAYHCEFFCCAV
jgi:hypothetical protein